MVGCCNCLCRQTVALCAHDYGKARNCTEQRVVNGDGVVAQRHCGSGEARLFEFGNPVVNPCPGYKKHAAHGYSYGTAVQGVARAAREQYGVNAQCGCAAEYGTYVSGVNNAVYDNNAACSAAYLLQCRFCGAAHGAKNSACERVAGELCKQCTLSGIYRDVAATLYYACSITLYVPPFAQQGKRLVPGIKGYVYDLGALGNEYSVFLVVLPAELRLGKGAEYLHPWVVEALYLYYWHGGPVFWTMCPVSSYAKIVFVPGYGKFFLQLAACFVMLIDKNSYLRVVDIAKRHGAAGACYMK